MLPDPVDPEMEEIVVEETVPEMPEGLILPVVHPRIRVSSSFGEKRGKSRWHKGVDFEVPEGTPVVATQAGVTRFSGSGGAYGELIVIGHEDGTETAYAHLKIRYLAENEPVAQGDEIGLVGRTGNATANHLHFEIRRDGVRVDPKPWLSLAANP